MEVRVQLSQLNAVMEFLAGKRAGSPQRRQSDCRESRHPAAAWGFPRCCPGSARTCSPGKKNGRAMARHKSLHVCGRSCIIIVVIIMECDICLLSHAVVAPWPRSVMGQRTIFVLLCACVCVCVCVCVCLCVCVCGCVWLRVICVICLMRLSPHGRDQ